MARGGGIDGVRRPRNTRQIRARGSDLHDSAGVLAARQANLLDGKNAEARARADIDGNGAVHTGGKGARENTVEIKLHALCRDPAGAEDPKGTSRNILVNDLSSYTQERLPRAHRRAFRAASIAGS